jgi:hypothetical protein
VTIYVQNCVKIGIVNKQLNQTHTILLYSILHIEPENFRISIDMYVSILDQMIIYYRPYGCVLGQIPGTDLYRDMHSYHEVSNNQPGFENPCY